MNDPRGIVRSKVLQHESLAMTLRYAHLTKPDVSAKFRRVSPLDNLRPAPAGTAHGGFGQAKDVRQEETPVAKGATRMDWPGKQSVRGMLVKKRGFWKDPRTLRVLWDVKKEALSEVQATQILRTLPAMLGHRQSDVHWYILRYDRKGWPRMSSNVRVDS